MWRRRGAHLEVFLVHPGGPFWSSKDLGAWSIPKGEYGDDEDARTAAEREFQEETGIIAPDPLYPLGALRQPSGKLITAWAAQGDCDPATIVSNQFEMEWPPRSGKMRSFPEIDRAAWLSLGEARAQIQKGQAPFLDRLERALARPARDGAPPASR
jgi:predicted NUDIX family NTP pyrophosphohydrolase